MRVGWLRRLTPLLMVALLATAAVLLHHQLRSYHYEDVRRGIAAISSGRIALALALTVLSYAILTGYDALALRYVGRALPYRRIAFASFLGYTFAHNLGLSVLGGAAPRYRLYTAWGLGAGEIGLVVAFTAATFWLGIFATAGVALVLEGEALGGTLGVPPGLARILGCALLAIVALYLLAAAVRRRPLRLRGWRVPLPRLRVALAQIAVAMVDWITASAVLWAVLPPQSSLSFFHFVALFVVAQLAGVSSHVPGGLGVFETVILFASAPHASAPEVVSALLVYRGIYYLLPLAVATAMLAVYEGLQRRERLARIRSLAGRWLPELAPRLLAAAIFCGGALLLFSGAAPRHAGRLDWLSESIPLSILEVSHFLASIVGLGLVLLASGLQRRLDAAYHLAAALLGTGALLALFKGFDYEESLVLLAMLAALVACRGEFHRRASLLGEPFTIGWVTAIVAALGASIWLGFFVHKHTEYSHELWWEFSFFADAPRFLRASVGVCVAALGFAFWHLLRPVRFRTGMPDREALATARGIVAASPVASARLALLGDKSFLFSEDRRAFIMYAVSGRSCVAMGDPVGPIGSASGLVWEFLELCEGHALWPVFYEASAAALSLYVDAGLTPLKFGEEARVALADLSLEGGSRKKERNLLRSIERDGIVFEVLPPECVPAHLPKLAAISAEWLREKKSREKSFSLGSFDPDYLAQFPIAVARGPAGLVAFANLWCGADCEELAPDLMRYGAGAPQSVMEYLFLQIALWAREQGYRWLNLGMAPLAGLEARASAPLWNRLGSLAFRYGEQFYHFQGLRRFKEKFHPEWQPKYLVYPGGIILPRVLTNITALVSGGIRGVVAR